MASSLTVILRLVLLIAATYAHHISSTPPRIAEKASNHLLRPELEGPRKASSDKEVLHGYRRLNRLAMIAVASTKYVVWMITSLEVASRLLALSSYPSSAALLAGHSTSVSALTSYPYSSAFILSALSIFVGFLIRKACFNTMGRLFTFTHTTLSGHKLMTSGPYGIVRHPSYTGEVMVRGGMVVLLLSPGGWVAESGLLSYDRSLFGSAPLQAATTTIAAIGLIFYIGWVTFACTYLILRAPREDETLHQCFGPEWEAYAKQVPYRFIPFIA